MEISYKGKKIPAYPLLMRKEFALEIVNGRKTIETRWDSKRYFAMFTDRALLEQNLQLLKEKREEETVNTLREDVWAIHFYSTGAPWTLDVLFDDFGLYAFTEENIKKLQDEYNFHEFDDYLADYEGVPDDKRPLFYWFHIDEIVGHSKLI